MSTLLTIVIWLLLVLGLLFLPTFIHLLAKVIETFPNPARLWFDFNQRIIDKIDGKGQQKASEQ